MRLMWEADPDDRPTFRESSVVVNTIVSSLSTDADYSYTMTDSEIVSAAADAEAEELQQESSLTEVITIAQEYGSANTTSATDTKNNNTHDNPYADQDDLFPEIYY